MEEINEPSVIGGVGEKKSNNGTQWYQQDRIYSGGGISIALATCCLPYYAFEVNKMEEKEKVTAAAQRGREQGQNIEISNREVANAITTVTKDSLAATQLSIRKLTGKECYRLMGFTDLDCDRAREVISESMIYHTAGDSIVVNVLMAILGQMM